MTKFLDATFISEARKYSHLVNRWHRWGWKYRRGCELILVDQWGIYADLKLLLLVVPPIMAKSLIGRVRIG